MNALRAIYTRELKAYFNAPIAYVFILVFVLLNNGLFMAGFFFNMTAEMRGFFGLMPWILAIFMPAVSMRLWAEDRRQGTFEMLRTMPVSVTHLVLAKFFAGLTFFAAALAATVAVPLFLGSVGTPDFGPIVAGYLGTLLLGAFYLSAGLFASGISRDQIVAFIVGMIIAVLFTLLGMDFIAAQIDVAMPGVGSALRDHVAVSKPFEEFTRGVIEFRTLIYFVLMTVGFLALDVLTIHGLTRPALRRSLAFGGVLAIAGVMLTNIALGRASMGRIDMTEEGLFTTSQATANVLQALESPVEIKLYISAEKRMPAQLITLERDIKDQVNELAKVAGGNLQFKVIHLDPSTKDEAEIAMLDELFKKGIKSVQVTAFGDAKRETLTVFSTLQVTYEDKRAETMGPVMPQVLPTLEYELLTRVIRLTRDSKPKVVFVAPIQQTESNKELAKLYAQLGQQFKQEERNDFKKAEEALRQSGDYEVHRLRSKTAEKPIPEDADLVIVLSPEPLAAKRIAELKKLIHKGVPVILGVQRSQYGYRAINRGISVSNRPVDSGLDSLLEPLGVSVPATLVMDKQSTSLSLNVGQRMGPFAVPTPINIPTHVVVAPKQFNTEVSITSGVSNLLNLWGSPVEVDAAKMGELSGQFTPLFSSTEEAWVIPVSEGQLTQDNLEPQAGGTTVLAGLYEFNHPALDEGGKAGERARMILFGNGELFKDNLIGAMDHRTLLLNSVDALTNGEAVIGLRAKAPKSRYISDEKTLQKLKSSQAFYRTLVVGGSPALVLGLGLFGLARRRRRREDWMQERKAAQRENAA
jgi:ABC-2 type transport system permease protein